MNLLARTARIFDRLIDLCVALAALILFLTWMSICVNVAMRFFLHRPQVWVMEFSEYGILYITFLGGAWVLKKEGHVKVDWVLNYLKPRNCALLNTITSFVGIILFLIITWYGAETTWSHFVRGTYRITLLEIPMYLILAVIPIGSFFISIQFLSRAYDYIKKWRSLQKNSKLLI